MNLTIVTKCEQYNDLATKCLFRLNNIHYILKSLQRTSLLDLVAMTEPDCEKYYQELIQELKNSYQKSWAFAGEHCAVGQFAEAIKWQDIGPGATDFKGSISVKRKKMCCFKEFFRK